MQWAKPRDVPVFIVGHVTKEGAIAGPRVLEHMVDAVLYLEGERHHQYRILRAVKNRFGSTDEVGVFEMADVGLREVRNPSEAFLEERAPDSARFDRRRDDGGNAADPGRGAGADHADRLRPAAPQRQRARRRTGCSCWSAVLQKRVGLALGSQDIYANVVGGLRIGEPAADLAVALAIASSFRESPIDPRTVGRRRDRAFRRAASVSQLERRLGEAQRLGFTRAIVPATARQVPTIPGLEIRKLGSVGEAIQTLLVPAPGRARAARRAEPERPRRAPVMVPPLAELDPDELPDDYDLLDERSGRGIGGAAVGRGGRRLKPRLGGAAAPQNPPARVMARTDRLS